MSKTGNGLPRQDGTSLTHKLGKNYIAVPLSMFVKDDDVTEANPGFSVYRRRTKTEMQKYLEEHQ